MPEDVEDRKPPQERPDAAAKKPGGPAKAKSAEREARLAEALRENLRRRKARAGDRKED